MNRAAWVLGTTLTSLLPAVAWATPCALCNASTSCTGSSEVCLGGLPENDGMNGRCVVPCPSPGAPFGGCATNYTCVPLTDGSNVCVPRSDDCTNINNYVPAAPGQSCSTQSCTDNALCVGGVCARPCSGFGQPGCPNGEFCGFIGLPDNPFFICGHGVNEGDTCNSNDLCTVGLCLNDGTSTRCFRNCGTGAASSSCQPSQTCDTINLNSGEMISLCTPPMSSGSPDGGVPSFPDAATSFPDATTTFPDAFVPPGQDAQVSPGQDAQVPPCACDVTTACDPGCESCDPECRSPGADASVVQPGEDGGTAAAADAGTRRPGGGGSVVRRDSSCTCVAPSARAPAWLLLALALPLWLRRRR